MIENDYDMMRVPNPVTHNTWADAGQMLADILTKLKCKRDPLPQVPHSGRWQLEPPEDTKMKKLQIRTGRHARKTAKRDQKGWDHDGCGRV